MINSEVIAKTDRINETLAAHAAAFRVTNEEVFKNNYGRRNGLILRPTLLSTKSVCSPVYYPDPDFWRKSEEYLADILEHFFDQYMDSSSIHPDEVKDYLNPDRIREEIMPRVFNASNAGSMELDGLIHREILDLSIGYCIPISEEADIRVSRKLLEKVKISEKEADQCAFRNLYGQYFYAPLRDVLSGMGDEVVDSPLNVLTTLERRYGAACMLSEKIMNEVCSETGNNLVILPSSIHEVLILNADREFGDLDGLIDIVRNINATVLKPEDRLSDNVYLYSRQKGLRALY